MINDEIDITSRIEDIININLKERKQLRKMNTRFN